jgi:hypothetical protein
LGDRYLLHLNRLKAANHSIDVDFAARLPPLADQRATFKEQKIRSYVGSIDLLVVDFLCKK